eukprot:3128289-Pleurochrysis_carterae.AAC.5
MRRARYKVGVGRRGCEAQCARSPRRAIAGAMITQERERGARNAFHSSSSRRERTGGLNATSTALRPCVRAPVHLSTCAPVRQRASHAVRLCAPPSLRPHARKLAACTGARVCKCGLFQGVNVVGARRLRALFTGGKARRGIGRGAELGEECGGELGGERDGERDGKDGGERGGKLGGGWGRKRGGKSVAGRAAWTESTFAPRQRVELVRLQE